MMASVWTGWKVWELGGGGGGRRRERGPEVLMQISGEKG